MKKVLYILMAVASFLAIPFACFCQSDTTSVDIGETIGKITEQFNLIFAATLPVLMYFSQRVEWVRKNLTEMRWRTLIVAVLLGVALVGLGSSWKALLLPFVTSPFVYEWLLKPFFGQTKDVTE